ncbi:hypothetical protein QJ856_gp0527 [Tupanvirus deep ocean]|uniref:Uncharacterized protein n=2 Tax=Tupanvirus TaxID=2094720 RepID=A0AC62A929_9VIRU|nr:hypothetical protein QJ856_gp0527 [Tupanvirus deep ocean]QKU34219.1 hypothetical protein [Tupanvirus deep ocean]
MSTNTYKNPSTMSSAEIVSFLNSGQYISSSLRNQLQEKLDNDRKSNRFSALDEFFAVVGSGTKDNVVKKNTKKENKAEHFPSLKPLSSDKTTTPNNTTILSANNQPPINYGVIINPDSTHTSFNQNNVKPLFVGDKMILHYDDIQNMYNEYAVHRIRLHFLSLNRKIDTLNLLEKVDATKGKQFKSKFCFDRLVSQEKSLRKCIEICIALNYLQTLFKDIGLGAILNNCKALINLGKTNFDHKDINKLCEDANNLFCDCGDMLLIFDGDYFKYQNNIKEYLNFSTSTISKIMSHNNKTIQKIFDETDKIYYSIGDMIDQIIKENDPHIDCDYCVNIGSSESNPILPEGISTWTFLSCDDEINTSVYEKLLDKDTLSFITEDQLESYFNKRKKYNDADFIRIYIKNHKQYCISIYYYLQEIIPKPKMTVKIENLPVGSSIFTSMLRNYDLDEKIDVPVVVPQSMTPKLWLRRRIKNELYRLSKEEYENLDTSWKKAYTYDDTSKNGFVVDYVFNELLNKDDSVYLKPEMLNSFRDLAISTSTISQN